MKPSARRPASYETVVLGILAQEFDFSDPVEFEEKVKVAIRTRHLGSYDPARVQLLRRFKTTVQNEVLQGENSQYFIGRHGGKAPSGGTYGDMDDFDRGRMAEDYGKVFSELSRETIEGFLKLAMVLYYLK